MSTYTNDDVYMKAAGNVYTKLFYGPATIALDSNGSLVTTDEIMRSSGYSIGDYMTCCKGTVEAAMLEYGRVFSSSDYEVIRDRLISVWEIWALSGFEDHNKPTLKQIVLPCGNYINPLEGVSSYYYGGFVCTYIHPETDLPSIHPDVQMPVLYMAWLNYCIDHADMTVGLNTRVTGLTYEYTRVDLLRALTRGVRSPLIDAHLSDPTIHPSPYLVPINTTMPMCLSNVMLSVDAPRVEYKATYDLTDPTVKMIVTQDDLYVMSGFEPEMYPAMHERDYGVVLKGAFGYVDLVYQFSIYSRMPIACYTMSALDKVCGQSIASRIRSTLRNGKINIIDGCRWNLNSPVLPGYQEGKCISKVRPADASTGASSVIVRTYDSLEEISRDYDDAAMVYIYKCIQGGMSTSRGYQWIVGD